MGAAIGLETTPWRSTLSQRQRFPPGSKQGFRRMRIRS
jgi:hypothetical protein